MNSFTFLPTFAGWRAVARHALADGVPPDDAVWEELGADAPALDLFNESAAPANHKTPRVPLAFLELAQRVACHRAPERWGYLYRTLWRLTHGEPHLLAVFVDPDVHALMKMDKAIRHDVHKMRAFVRFRKVERDGETFYVAWFEPLHLIVELNAPFFVSRFANMRWSILTPDRCAHWDGAELTFTGGATRAAAASEDAMEELWRTYYAHIFNPARVKIHAMQAEMPKHYWKNLPEAALIPELIKQAPSRVDAMIQRNQATLPLAVEPQQATPPIGADWEELRAAAAKCSACPLYANATQTVFGEGPLDADIVFLGEQPGDQEDLGGKPFIGPAGKLLDRALVAAGIDRGRCYVTNSVKHFKWEPRGKRRLHQKPNELEVHACRPWWQAEVKLIQPRVLVCLGGTAGKAVFGREVKVMKERGSMLDCEYAPKALITVHPSALLRLPDPALRESEFERFVADLSLLKRK